MTIYLDGGDAHTMKSRIIITGMAAETIFSGTGEVMYSNQDWNLTLTASFGTVSF